MLLILVLIVLNVGIAWWNCYAVGSVWNQVRNTGGWFDKLLIYSAAIQSVAGFSVPIVLALTWVVTTIMGGGDAPRLTPEQVQNTWAAVMNMWYVAVIIPVVGSGFVIWGHSVREAFHRRDAMSIGIATYNTLAQASNTYSMFANLGNVLGELGSMAKSKDGLPILAVLIVIVSLLSSVLLTVHLIQKYARKATIQLSKNPLRA